MELSGVMLESSNASTEMIELFKLVYNDFKAETDYTRAFQMLGLLKDLARAMGPSYTVNEVQDRSFVTIPPYTAYYHSSTGQSCGCSCEEHK